MHLFPVQLYVIYWLKQYFVHCLIVALFPSIQPAVWLFFSLQGSDCSLHLNYCTWILWTFSIWALEFSFTALNSAASASNSFNFWTKWTFSRISCSTHLLSLVGSRLSSWLCSSSLSFSSIDCNLWFIFLFFLLKHMQILLSGVRTLIWEVYYIQLYTFQLLHPHS